ncbi:TetR/AcrR family transcriptional regulator [Klebsiella pneumoniae]|uniref:TetR/AcrR family transcriptional regulator n=1 Tax=Klebsiella pneumoniae TaxID=573 RepID=UPI0010917DE4|nr:TetR/AcrR family transcriptional regulator [Klebsiella pneumoniae]MBK2735354.1 TetR/AcrR family transcriptional regulator [Klebsiella pneumoniae]VGB99665.1 transcriptional regulator [Klebsiella pneumoniae]
MGRINKRDDLLEAVVAIIERDGLTPVTLDAVAIETGMTRAGLLYHFPSREALVRATHEHLTAQWESDLIAQAGKTANEATEAERHAAYINVCVTAARRVELLLMLENSEAGGLGELWQEIIDRWAPPAPEPDDAVGVDRFIARIAADGLWMHEALSAKPLSPALRRRIVARLADLLGGQS